MATTATMPPMRQSEEAKPETLDMARKQGEAYMQALKHMAEQEAHDGGMTHAGHYVVAYAVEKAEGMWEPQDATLQWQKPGEANVHIEVAVADAADHRFVPHLDVTVTLTDEQGNEIGTERQPFVWHPWLYHYGRNWKVPGDGTYRMKVVIARPGFHRHDPVNGERYPDRVEVEFDHVKISTGQK
jgi:hypothetical protein